MKKNLPPNPLTSLKAKIAKYLLEDEVIMNWSILNKCILILILGSLVHIIDQAHLPRYKIQGRLRAEHGGLSALPRRVRDAGGFRLL